MGKTLEEQTIGSFKLPTDAGFSSGDTIVLEIWNSSGQSEGQYSFVDDENTGAYGLAKSGWYPYESVMWGMVTDDKLSDDVVLPFGCGAIITSGEQETIATISGEVIMESKTYPIVGGGISWTGNCTPVKIWLRDFALPADSGFSSGDTIVLEIWNSSGQSEGQYSFVDDENTGAYGLTNPGWYPYESVMWGTVIDDELANEKVSLNPGQMVVVTSGEGDTTVTLPDPTTVVPVVEK